jgi:hypothetical protein
MTKWIQMDNHMQMDFLYNENNIIFPIGGVENVKIIKTSPSLVSYAIDICCNQLKR